MIKNKLKIFLFDLAIFFISILITFIFINFLLIKISSQNLFPRSLAASLPNTLLTFYPNTYNKNNLTNFTAVLGNSVAQGNGDAYLEGKKNYSITHNLYEANKKNYLIFGRAGHHSIAAVANLIKVYKLTNQSFMTENLNKPNSIIFYFYEGIDLVWNYDLYTGKIKKDQSIKQYTTKLIKAKSNPTFLEKFFNFFPLLPFIGSFFEDSKNLIMEMYKSNGFKESFFLIVDRVKKILGFYIVLNDREMNNLTWTNSLKDHKDVKNIRPIQGASETLNTEQMKIALEIFYESVKHAQSWSKAKDITIVYIPAPITVYDWNEPIIYERQSLNPESVEDVKTINNNKNRLNNIFLRREIKNFSKKNSIYFLDTTDELIEKGKNEVLHGPLDWGHLNYNGYKIVSDFIMEKNSQK